MLRPQKKKSIKEKNKKTRKEEGDPCLVFFEKRTMICK